MVMEETLPAEAGKRALLFGKTGSGKSTIANMLVQGDLDCEPLRAPIGNGMRGTTTDCVQLTGRGWNVVDTVGFGEPPSGSVPNDMAKNVVFKFLQKVKGPFSHIIFVQKRGRCDGMDKIIWKTFLEIFKGGEKNIVVVFTDAHDGWLRQNMVEITQEYPECKKFLAVDFPGKDADPEMEEGNRELRLYEREKFEDGLHSMFIEWGGIPVTPEINGMNNSQLETKSTKILRQIVGLIKTYFADHAFLIISIGLEVIQIIVT